MAEIIAIDGPAGAGKSTVARRVATLLDYTYLDTGAMYRAVAWLATVNGTDLTDHHALIQIATTLDLTFGPLTSDGKQSITVNSLDATDAIRTPEVSSLTSSVSAIAELRQVVVDQQRFIAQGAKRGVVLEGRDIGTVVFPNAQLKIFLTAGAEERARRRYTELQNKGNAVKFEDVLRDQRERDSRDSGRETSPLIAAADASHVNTDGLSIDEVVEHILALYSSKRINK